MAKHEFPKSKKAGDIGQKVMYHHIRCRPACSILPETALVTLLHDNPSYFSRDIDFGVSSKNYSYFVEVKTENKGAETGNLAIETVKNIRTNEPGWLFYCKAEWVVIYAPHSQQVFWFKMAELLKAWHEELSVEYRGCLLPCYDSGKTSINLCLPPKILLAHVSGSWVENLNYQKLSTPLPLSIV